MMVHRISPSMSSGKMVTSIRLGLVLLLAALVTLGCAPRPAGKPLPSQSLLEVTPFLGDEAAVRNPAPQPTRMYKPEESVLGWIAPPERKLRFPVELREGARLTFRVGAIAEIGVRHADIVLKVEFVPNTSGNRDASESPEPIELYNPGVSGMIQCFRIWNFVDIPLENCAPGKGELCFIVEGRLAGHPKVPVLWGQPAVHYPDERRHRNVLLIGVDTLRADGVSVYGGRAEATPNLEEFSKSGTVFNHAWSQAPWTLPSFASMVTGEFPGPLGATGMTEHIPQDAETIGETLFSLGYTTATMCSNNWLGNDQSGFHQGMEGLWFRSNAEAQVILDRAKAFVSRSARRDWFCFLHFMDPHVPYVPPEKYVNEFCDPTYRGRFESGFDAYDEWAFGLTVPSDEEIKRVRDLYDGEVADLDEALGELFEFLESTDMMKDTLIIFASDHGEEFYEHGEFGHGGSQYDELIWVPLMVRGDGFEAGKRLDTAVGNIDIVPTILKYVGAAIDDGLPGVPLQDVTAGRIDSDRIIFGEETAGPEPSKMAVQWPYKCILSYITGKCELYDLSSDPAETSDIADEHPDITARLSGEIIAAMPSKYSMFFVSVTGNANERPRMFTGSVELPGGIKSVRDYGMTNDDRITVEENTIRFSILSSAEVPDAVKIVRIVPAAGGDTLDASVRVDGRVEGDRFFPYGTPEPEPSGSATVNVYDMPWPASLPPNPQGFPSALYILGVPGYLEGEEATWVELDPETREQLRALGYIN